MRCDGRRTGRRAVVLVTHAQGGVVAARAAASGREGKRGVVLRPVLGAAV